MKRFLCLLIVCISLLSYAQNAKGIQWTTNLSWQQVKQKAKADNKYIFLDCFTTWCGPCKRMEFEVYNNDSVGNFINSLFIPVKIQMDKTDHDSKEIQSWYNDVKQIEKLHKINAYPTLLFLSPDGETLVKNIGYKNSDDFIALAKNAMQPGVKYNDPYKEYDSLLSEYRIGNKVYNKFPYLIKVSKELGQTYLLDSLNKDYSLYLLSLPKERLYTKENLTFLAANIRSSKENLFSLFYPNGKKVNKIMNMQGYAERLVDKVIRIEIANPFLANIDSDRLEPTWNLIYEAVKKQYSSNIAERSVLSAKVKRYLTLASTKGGASNMKSYLRYATMQINKYGENSIIMLYDDYQYESNRDLMLNQIAWQIFSMSDDTSQIKSAIKWMKPVVDRSLSIGKPWAGDTRDTYANLMYKIGKEKEAIKIEEEVVKLVTEAKSEGQVKNYTETLNKMRAGIPTWK